MKNIFTLAVAFLFVLSLVQGVEPLPPELEKSYKTFRDIAKNELGSVLSLRSYSLDNITLIMREMLYHDSGLLTPANSEMVEIHGDMDLNATTTAKEYLIRNVIDPLKENGSVILETGEILKFEEVDDEDMLQLLFYYVRDHIHMAGPEDVPGNEQWSANLPGIGRFVISKENVVQFPAETIAWSRAGICFDKALTLAALLKLDGYEVAFGYWASWGIEIFGRLIRFPGYHSYVLVKDEGWGIGDWTIEGAEDMYGKPMKGKWIVLDPLYSPSYAPQMQMVGEHRSTGFAETPPWAVDINPHQIPSELAFLL